MVERLPSKQDVCEFESRLLLQWVLGAILMYTGIEVRFLLKRLVTIRRRFDSFRLYQQLDICFHLVKFREVKYL